MNKYRKDKYIFDNSNLMSQHNMLKDMKKRINFVLMIWNLCKNLLSIFGKIKKSCKFSNLMSN